MTGSAAAGPAGKRTIWMHIGTEKTGTSTIQTACVWNKELLAAAGVLYPSAPVLEGTRTHAGLVYYAAEDLDLGRMPQFRGAPMSAQDVAYHRQTMITRLGEEVEASGMDTVLLSSEHLSSCLRKPPSVARLIGGLREIADEVRVVIYLRPQYQVYPSAYSTQIKGGSNRPGKPPVRANNRFYNYDLMLQLWEEAVGRENMVVRLFERARFVNGDLLDDFFSTVGFAIPPEFRRPAKSRNRSLDADTMEFLRLANGLRPDNANAADWHGLIRQLEEGSDREALAVPADILQRIERLYAESNSNVAKRYFPELERGLFEPLRPPVTDEPPGLTINKAIAIGLRLWLHRSGQEREAADD